MKHFGKIFKTFREARNLSLSDVATDLLSKSQLSRFENGQTDLTITKFMLAIDQLHVPIDEFCYVAHQFHLTDFEEVIEQTKLYLANRDQASLKQLLIAKMEGSTNQTIFETLLMILLKIKLSQLTTDNQYSDDEITLLTNYLFQVDYWGRYELLLFSHSMEVLTHSTLMILTKEMVRRTDFYKGIPYHRHLISKMLLSAYMRCIESDEWLDACYCEKQLQNCFFKESELYERMLFHYAQKAYQFKVNKDKKAILEMRKCIAAVAMVSSHHVAEALEDYLNLIQKPQNDVADRGRKKNPLFNIV